MSTQPSEQQQQQQQHTQIITLPLLHDPELPPGGPPKRPGGLPTTIYWGQQVEHPNKMTLFVNSDSAEIDASLSTALQTAIDAPLLDRVLNVHLEPPPPPLLACAPVIESAIFTLKRDVSRATWCQQQAAVDRLLDVAEGCGGHSAGFVVGGDDVFVVLVAWVSVEAHEKWARWEMGRENSVLKRYRDLTEKVSSVHVAMRGLW
ncbi:hypothetical protein FN846DRAFT_914634 [Sphaerosporella brunnea]|uniref:ABM domain-containing protein n=1 Tax=Sphaerosporella brunnea TaxID=1250544 RepID=A0A5J5EBQ5_9PEZI|nr:hypothetical protein FN846DRAFT_914634 [Sphaerosporella brunnea]